MTTRETRLCIGIAIVVIQNILTFLAVWRGSKTIKKQVEVLFTQKAPSTVLGIFWKISICQTLKFAIVGSIGSLDDEDLDPDTTRNDLTGWTTKLSSTFAFVSLCLTMVCCARVAERYQDSESAFISQSAAMLVMACHMTPGWSFKGMTGDFVANMDALVNQSPVWAFHLLWAVLVLVVCSIASGILPGLDDVQPYCLAVLGLAGASFGCGVAYSFQLIANNAAGDLWATDILFQTVYTLLMTILCVLFVACIPQPQPTVKTALRQGDHGRSPRPVQTSSFQDNLVKFVRIIPGFVAAWAWEALGQAIFKEVWPIPEHLKDQILRQLILAGGWGIVALLFAFLSVALATIHPSSLDDDRSAIFTSIGGCNVGWAWKNFGTQVYNDTGKNLVMQWVITCGLTLTVPIIAAGLMSVIACTSELPDEDAGFKMSPTDADDESEEPICACSPRDDDSESEE